MPLPVPLPFVSLEPPSPLPLLLITSISCLTDKGYRDSCTSQLQLCDRYYVCAVIINMHIPRSEFLDLLVLHVSINTVTPNIRSAMSTEYATVFGLRRSALFLFFLDPRNVNFVDKFPFVSISIQVLGRVPHLANISIWNESIC